VGGEEIGRTGGRRIVHPPYEKVRLQRPGDGAQVGGGLRIAGAVDVDEERVHDPHVTC